jgi:CDGSH-type Zn-finger protein
LHFIRHDGGNPETPPEHDSVTVMTGGPLYIRGLVRLRAADGSVIVEDTRMALCRCGQSHNKPFCDNSHLGVAFDDLGAAPEAEAKHHANGK